MNARPANRFSILYSFVVIGMVMLTLVGPQGSASPDKDGIDGISVVPEVGGSQYSATNINCSGEYAVHTNTESTTTKWTLLVFWHTDKKVKTTTTVDYSYECSATFEMTVEGTGGIDRRVGVRGPASESVSVPTPLAVSASVSLERDQEIEGGCSYLVGGCSFTYEIPLESGEMKTGTDERPTEVCSHLPDVTMFNRIDSEAAKIGDLKDVPGYDPLVEVTKTSSGGGEECITIDWEKVDSLDLIQDLAIV